MYDLASCYYMSGTSNEKGERDIIDFRSDESLIISASFHTYSWNVDTNEDNYDTRTFNRKEKEYSISILVPNGEEGKEVLDRITNITEKDVLNKNPGRIYFGDLYLEGYFVNSTVAPSDFGRPKRDMTFLSINPNWIYEVEYIGNKKALGSDDGLDYNYDYLYDYYYFEKGILSMDVPGYLKSSFNLELYGPIIDPLLYIDNRRIQVFETLYNNEKIIISNKNNKNTVYKVLSAGDKINIFDKRSKDTSIFEKLSFGEHMVTWDGSFAFKFLVFIEFSEPLRGDFNVDNFIKQIR